MSSPPPRFRSVILDIDSTLSAIEGIDWLAALRGSDVKRRVAASTERAMRGEIPLESVYAERLTFIKPSRFEVKRLAQEYVERAQPGALESLAKLTNSGIRVDLISAGLRQAVLPLAHKLGVSDDRLHAVDVTFGADGSFAGFDERSPLTRNGGKADLARTLSLPGPILAVGDGVTDLEIKRMGVADAFAAYTGVVIRPEVVREADYVMSDFEALIRIVIE